MKPTNTFKFSKEDCIEMMQESLDHMTPNYVDFDNVVESPFHDTPSVSIELPSLLDEVSTTSTSSQCGLFCDVDPEILNQIDKFTQREMNSDSSALQHELYPTNSSFEQPNNNCAVDNRFTHYHQYHQHYPPRYTHDELYPYSREHVYQVDRQLSELSDRCDKLEQLNLAQQAELTEIKKRFALIEHANVDSLFKKRNKRAKHTNQYPNPTVKVPKRQCSVCRTYGPTYGMNCEKSNDRKKCRNFEVDGTPKCQLCIAYREKGSNLNCGKKNVYQTHCTKYFEPGGIQKNESKV